MPGLNVPLLLYLRARQTVWTLPATLCDHLKLSGEDLWEDIGRLRGFGFGIEDRPHRGLRYLSPCERLCPDLIEHELDTRLIGKEIRVYESCRSTNDLARTWADRPHADGTVFLAEYQTAGRGRQGARWFCPPRMGILCSVLLVGRNRLPSQNLLTSLAATAAGQTVRDVAGLDARLKWPNDVRVGRHKIAGVLVESGDRASVLGIGLNVNAAEGDFPQELRGQAASLRSLTGRRYDRSQIVRDLLTQLDMHYHWVTSGREDRLWSAWMGMSDFAGSRALVETSGKRLKGRIVDFSPRTGVVFSPDTGGPFEVHPSHILEIHY